MGRAGRAADSAGRCVRGNGTGVLTSLSTMGTSALLTLFLLCRAKLSKYLCQASDRLLHADGLPSQLADSMSDMTDRLRRTLDSAVAEETNSLGHKLEEGLARLRAELQDMATLHPGSVDTSVLVSCVPADTPHTLFFTNTHTVIAAFASRHTKFVCKACSHSHTYACLLHLGYCIIAYLCVCV